MSAAFVAASLLIIVAAHSVFQWRNTTAEAAVALHAKFGAAVKTDGVTTLRAGDRLTITADVDSDATLYYLFEEDGRLALLGSTPPLSSGNPGSSRQISKHVQMSVRPAVVRMHLLATATPMGASLANDLVTLSEPYQLLSSACADTDCKKSQSRDLVTALQAWVAGKPATKKSALVSSEIYENLGTI